MRELDVARVTDAVAKLAIDACNYLGDDVVAFFEKALKQEESETGRDILGQLLENAKLAKDSDRPLCQDTGLAVVFLEVGQDVHLVGGSLEEAVDEGVRKGYAEGYLRKSARCRSYRSPQEHRRQYASPCYIRASYPGIRSNDLGPQRVVAPRT